MSALSKKTQSIKPKKPTNWLDIIFVVLGISIAILISALDTPNQMTADELQQVVTMQESQK